MAIPPDFIELFEVLLGRSADLEAALAKSMHEDPAFYGLPQGAPLHVCESAARALVRRTAGTVTRKAGELALAPTDHPHEDIEA